MRTELDSCTGNDCFHICGINIGIVSFQESTNIIKELFEKKYSSYICIVNVHVLVTAVRHLSFKRIIDQADWNFADGMPIVWYARKRLGLDHVERIAGPSVMNKCFDELRDAKHFFYGSSKETLNKLEILSRESYPKLNIVGSLSPPFRHLTYSERQHNISLLNEISPDIIWVALGAPKQEILMYELRRKLNRGVMIGVGAAFDYFVDNIKRPPVWLRRSGLEWLCRLCQEPNRLWKRYLITNSLFIFYMCREIMMQRHFLNKRKSIR